MNANTTCTATSTRWIPGANGDLVGIYVYYKDQSSLLQWKTNTNAETNTYSILGSDPTALTKRVLKDPEVYSLTWTTYPAESSCNAINGRLPMEGEVASIMANEGAYNQYGSFGSLSTNYWGADETTDYDTTEAAGRSSTTGNYTNSGKTNSYAVRCVADTPS
jgi:hypothetical protein